MFALTGEAQPDRYLEKDGIGTSVAKWSLTAHNQDSRYRRFSQHFCREIEIEIHSAWESTHRFQIQGEFPRFHDSTVAIQLFDVKGRFLHIAEIGEIFTIPEIGQSDQRTLARIFEANEAISAALGGSRGSGRAHG